MGLGHVGAAPSQGWGVLRGVPETLSITLEALSRAQKEHRRLLFPFKTRSEAEARKLAALFATLCGYKHAPIREEGSWEGPLSGGFAAPSRGDERGC